MSKARDIADSYTNTEVDTQLQTELTPKQNKRDITYLSENQHNNLMMVMNGRLYTTSGNSGYNNNSGTGRGVDNNVTLHSMENFTEVTFPELPEGVSLVDVGGDGLSFNYALFDNNWLYTWGQNGNGVCGLGHTTVVGFPTLALTDCVEVYCENHVSGSYAIAQQASLVKRTDGYIYGAGNGDDGQFGLGNGLHLSTFTQLPWMGVNPKYVKQSNAYGGILFCQKADGTIWGAGNGLNGTLFTGNSNNTTTAVEVTANIGGTSAGDVLYWHHVHAYHSGTSVVQHSFSLVARKDANGDVRVWTVGNNSWGQIGQGNTVSPIVPYEVISLPSNIKEIDVIGGGVPTVRALTTTGDLYTWGHNGQGQCGTGSSTSILSPTLVTTGVTELLMTEVGSHVNSYIMQNWVKKGDELWVCGFEDATCYTGMNLTTHVTSFTKNPYLGYGNNKVKFLGACLTGAYGRAYAAITEDNRLLAWGYNAHNAISIDNGTRIPTPQEIQLPEARG